MKILIVDDDPLLVETLKQHLELFYVIEVASTGEMAEMKIYDNEYDLVILDYCLPDKSGLEICRAIRKMDSEVKILILTGRDQIRTKVSLLDAGADDYMVKPFSAAELMARIRALFRRTSQSPEASTLIVGDLNVSLDKHTVYRGRRKIRLRPKEFILLEYLMRNKGKVVTRQQALDHVWDSAYEPMTNIIDVHIRRLREQVDKLYSVKLIKTVHGVGYKMDEG